MSAVTLNFDSHRISYNVRNEKWNTAVGCHRRPEQHTTRILYVFLSSKSTALVEGTSCSDKETKDNCAIVCLE